MDKELQKVAEAIDNFIEEEFKSNPYNFLCEEDIRSFLFYLIFKKFKDIRNIKGEKFNKKSDKISEEKEIRINPVKTQYSYNIFKEKSDINKNNKNDKFNIAIISDKFPISINGTYYNYNFWNREVKIGIEIKYLANGDFLDKLKNGTKNEKYENDFEKLKRYKESNNKRINFTGIWLIFFQTSLGNYNTSSKIEINNDKIKIQLDNNNKFNFKKIDNIKEHIKENEINAFLITPDEEGRIVTLFQLV